MANTNFQRKRFEGISSDQELHLQDKISDTRSIWKKASDSFTENPNILNCCFSIFNGFFNVLDWFGGNGFTFIWKKKYFTI